MNYQKIEALVAILDVIFEFCVKNPHTKLAPRPEDYPFYEAQHKTIRKTNSNEIYCKQHFKPYYVFFAFTSECNRILKSAFYLNLTVLVELLEN